MDILGIVNSNQTFRANTTMIGDPIICISDKDFAGTRAKISIQKSEKNGRHLSTNAVAAIKAFHHFIMEHLALGKRRLEKQCPRFTATILTPLKEIYTQCRKCNYQKGSVQHFLNVAGF